MRNIYSYIVMCLSAEKSARPVALGDWLEKLKSGAAGVRISRMNFQLAKGRVSPESPVQVTL